MVQKSLQANCWVLVVITTSSSPLDKNIPSTITRGDNKNKSSNVFIASWDETTIFRNREATLLLNVTVCKHTHNTYMNLYFTYDYEFCFQGMMDRSWQK